MVWYDWLVLTLILGGGFSMARLLSVPGVTLQLTSGLLFGVLWRELSFALVNVFSATEWSWALWLIGSIGAMALAAQRGVLPWLRGFAWALLLAGVAASTRIFGLAGTPHSDSIWIFTLSDLMAGGGDMAILNGRTSIKRGFAYPLMLSLGNDGVHLTSITPLIALMLAVASVWLVVTLLGGQRHPRLSWLAVGGAVALAIFTATVPLRSVFYVNGHTLLALGLLLLVAVSVLANRDGRLAPGHLAVAMAGIAVVATTRPEGIALAAVAALPLISQHWLARWQVVALISSATLPLSIWLAVYDSYILNATGIWWPIFAALLMGAGALVALRPFDWLRGNSVILALVAMVAVLVLAIGLLFNRLKGGLVAIWQNQFLTEGLWGYTLIGVLVIFVILGWRGTSGEYQTMLVSSLLILLGTLITKMLDGGQFGDPTLGRLGWSDSLNRMWLHGFAIFVVTAVVGIMQRRKSTT